MNEIELVRKFERKLRGEMSSQELSDFETLLASDESVKQKFKEHQEFIVAFKRYGNRKELKGLMEKAHEGYKYQEEIVIKKSSGTNWYYAIAASVVGVVLLSAAFFIGVNYSAEKNESTFLATSRKIQSLEAKQKALSERLLEGQRKVINTNTECVSGTAIMITGNGYLITNFHLVKDADSIIAYNNSHQPIKAQLVASEPLYDLAILKLEDSTLGKNSMLPYAFRSSELDLADAVFSLGYPADDLVYGQGNISSLAGFRGDSLSYQISIPVNPGNSGGPVIDDEGNIIGIISGKQTSREGIGFAIKSTYIKDFITQTMEKENTKITSKNSLKGLSKKDKIKKLKPYVFQVRVF